MDTACLVRRSMTVDEYLALEEHDTRYEYVDGDVVAMSGASPRHAAVAANVSGSLRQAVASSRRDCVVFDGSLRVFAPRTGSYLRPDVTVGCGELRYHPARPRCSIRR